MAEPKPLASLSAGLLARKGGARPAMRRQTQLPGSHAHGHGLDDLGWNDMGYDVDPSDGGANIGRAVTQGLSPMASPHPHSPLASRTPIRFGDDEPHHDAFDHSDEPAAVEPISGEQPAYYDDAPVPQVRLQQERIASELSPDVAPEMAPAMTPEMAPDMPVAADTSPLRSLAVPRNRERPRAQPGVRGNFAFTLRLDPQRHLRLRLATATSNRSAQQILVGLLDEFLASMPEIDAFATQLPATKTGR